MNIYWSNVQLGHINCYSMSIIDIFYIVCFIVYMYISPLCGGNNKFTLTYAVAYWI